MSLDGVSLAEKLELKVSGKGIPAEVSGSVLTLGQGRYAQVPAGDLGKWGSGDFAIQFTFHGGISKGGSDNRAPDNVDYAALFIRADPDATTSGPSAFIFDDGKILFRMSVDTAPVICPNAVPRVEHRQYKGLYSRKLRFTREGDVLRSAPHPTPCTPSHAIGQPWGGQPAPPRR